ncbi:MAG: DUF2931 family protein [Desulfobulbaceae bacterium]|nr:DUF2931 family protein [Desulfobulbaceae bacterium]
MKVDLLRKFLVASMLVTLLVSCVDDMKKYDWLASESAPAGYPMQILGGDFNDSNGGTLYIPDRKKIQHGWGQRVSKHVVGADKKQLPNRFDVLYFSYTENTFYQGAFDLPEKQIQNLFAEGYFEPEPDEELPYYRIVVGVAPGGLVSVWVQGAYKSVEVFSGIAEKVDAPWEIVYSGSKYSRSEYVNRVLEREIGQDRIDEINQNGIPLDRWKKYQTRYDWKPLVTGPTMPKVIKGIQFVNGERDYYSKAYDNAWENEPKAAPLSFRFNWKHKSDKVYHVSFELDAEEVTKAFEEVAKDGSQEIIFNIDIEEVENSLFYRIFVRSDSGSVELKIVSHEHRLSGMTGSKLEKFLREN